MNEMFSIDALVDKYKSVYYLEDNGIIPLVAATVLSNRMDGDPVWLMLVGPSSGGKSEIINMTLGVDYVTQISMLTSNTFLSAFNSSTVQPSLLHRIKNGVIAMKDFTTILSMSREAQIEIMGQMREIYDGHLVKETGTGRRLEWFGKISLIAGVTEKIYSAEQTFAQMGTRWITYVMKPQDRRKTTMRALDNIQDIGKKREEVRAYFKMYIDDLLTRLPDPGCFPAIPEHVKQNIVELTDFAALSRSPTDRNFKGEMTLAISSEMPMRMATQIIMLGQVFSFMNGGTLRPDHEIILYKLIMDCIPKGRFLVLEKLTAFGTASTSSLAARFGYPTPTVRMWLEDLTVRGLCARHKSEVIGEGDKWRASDRTRTLMGQFGGIVQGESDMRSTEGQPEIRSGDGDVVQNLVLEDPGVFEDDLKDDIKAQQAEMDRLFDAA